MSTQPGTADRIPAHNDVEARKRFFRFLNQSVQVVCPNAQWRAARLAEEDSWTAVTCPAAAVRMKTDGGCLYLRSTIKFDYGDHPTYPTERKVNTRFYAHTITEDEVMKLERFSWQWEPAGYPHLHVHRRIPGAEGLGRLHIPSGRVFLEHILLFAIEELGVKPACADWKEKLGGNLDRVSRWSTWGGLTTR